MAERPPRPGIAEAERLNVFPLRVPPLRERAADIPQLVMFFLGQFSKKFGRRIDSVPGPTMDRLARYAWSGNIRELQNVIERALVLCQGPALELDEDLLPVTSPRTVPTAGAPAPDLTAGLPTLEEIERAHILAALGPTGWLIEGAKGAAKILGLHPNTLRSRMDRLAIKRPRHGIS
ncbi:MAG TPA: helix-turn-helix domain-containing protein [Candidatus Methylomirabilis sp.]|nr:helix-turn-helix domain-containing protein [Candidatus Methylomirabilis sp.]